MDVKVRDWKPDEVVSKYRLPDVIWERLERELTARVRQELKDHCADWDVILVHVDLECVFLAVVDSMVDNAVHYKWTIKDIELTPREIKGLDKSILDAAAEKFPKNDPTEEGQ